MSTTLIGLFDDRDDALQARTQLSHAGIAEAAIRIETESGDSFGTGARTSEVDEDRRGFFSKLFDLDGNDDATPGHYAEAVRRGGTVLTVEVDDDSRVSEVTSHLEDAGAVDIDTRVQQWQTAGYTGYDPEAPVYTSEQVADERRNVLQVVEEDLKVGKRMVQRGSVRVQRRVTERPVTEQVTLRDERAFIERTAVNRPATEADLTASFQDETFELRESSEEAVVEKTARVVEEVRVGTQSSERTETINETLRRSDVDVQQIDSGEGRAVPDGKVLQYTGPERRIQRSTGYAGMERRAA